MERTREGIASEPDAKLRRQLEVPRFVTPRQPFGPISGARVPASRHHQRWAAPLVSAFFAGFLFAAISRDLKLFGQFVRGWPLSNEITNWGRVDELLAQAKQDAT
ncbi:hypothetical protein [Candidatus Aalborgicola defluviihabitans]|uniref:hypothetical protein n=1 Tax=Candidatus Aalborgicola defluviihabitans TaxID=3386187 RepID=UPI0039B9085A